MSRQSHPPLASNLPLFLLLFGVLISPVLAGEDRTATLAFPEDRSLGEILVREATDPILSDSAKEWTRLAPARGNVEVPLEGRIAVRVPEKTTPDLEAIADAAGERIDALFLKKTKTTDADLAPLQRFPNLRALNIGETEVTDEGIGRLENLKRLEWLRLDRLDLTSEGLAVLAKLPNLVYLNAYRVRLGGGSAEFIASLSSLRVLEISKTRVTDEDLEHLAGLINLERLSLKENPITNAGLKRLSGLTNLKNLNLFRTEITDSGLDALSTLTKLEELRLPIRITSAGVERLKDLPSLSLSERKDFTLRVVDAETKQPLPNAPIVTRWYSPKWKLSKDELVADANGELVFGIPWEAYSSFSFKAQLPRYVPTGFSWNEVQKADDFPGKFVLELETGTSIGGIVRDDAGNPIEGAQVSFSLSSVGDGEPRPSYRDLEFKSDGEGRWRNDQFPSEVDRLSLKISHPDYHGDDFYKRVTQLESLRAFEHETVLQTGLPMRGRVVTGEDVPIEGAHIYIGKNRYSDAGEAIANETGEFEFKTIPTGRQQLTVQAIGYAPEIREILIEAGIESQEFILEPGKTIKIKVVDAQGQPVPEASVSLGGFGRDSLRPIGFPSGRTGEDGSFVWNSAPDRAVSFSFVKGGWANKWNVSLDPQEEEHVVTLPRKLVVRGTVVDAETKEPIEEFVVVPVLGWLSRDDSLVERASAKEVKGGSFEIELDRTDIDHIVRVEASGYRAFESRRIDIEEGEVTVNIELHPAPNVTGTVVDSEGIPLGGVPVRIATKNQSVTLDGGGFRRSTKPLQQVTDSEGRFEFFPQKDPFVLVAAGDGGFGKVTEGEFLQDPRIVLRDWAKIEGRLAFKGDPVPDVNVSLNPIRYYSSGNVDLNTRANFQTDKEGKYSFEKVPHGLSYQLQAYVGVGYRDSTAIPSCESVPLKVEAGQTYTVDLGAEGTSIAGRVSSEKLGPDFNWKYAINYMVKEAPGIDPPPEIASSGFDVLKGWDEAWISSREGQAFFPTLHTHTVALTPEGEFEVHGVTPGKYHLVFRIFEPPKNSACLANPLATQSLEIVVPEGQADPIQLGEVEIEVTRIDLGDVVPEIQATTLGGELFRLSDYRGRYVLLDFWATWCGPCVAALPDLKGIVEDFAKPGEFTVLSLSLDRDLETLEKFVAGNDIPWTQVHLGDWSGTDVPARFGVSYLPAVFLIDRGGRLLERNIITTDLRKVIAAALDKEKRIPSEIP